MPFIYNTNQLTSFYLTIFYRKVFSKQAIEIWILIPIIPQNMLKLYAKKSTLNMTEFASLKKLTRKLSLWKEIFSSGMSLACLDLYKLIFQTFYHTSLISLKREIDETVNFRNFCKFFTKKLSAFLWHFGTPFSDGKNERSK